MNFDAAPPILPSSQPRPQRRAPTLWAIIALKLLVGIILLIAALAMHAMRHTNLYDEFRAALVQAGVDSESGAFAETTELLKSVTPGMIEVVAAGSALYGAVSLLQGAGLIFRAAWAVWFVIVESAVFVPIEIWDLLKHFSFVVLAVLAMNIAICWYLFARRRHLFGMG
jgi:uncharacterized membrane protein (DUF2068 family)